MHGICAWVVHGIEGVCFVWVTSGPVTSLLGPATWNGFPSLPVNPDPILTPPNIAPSGLHDTTAMLK